MQGVPFSCRNLHGTSVESMSVGPGRRKVENNAEPRFPRQQIQEVLSLSAAYISHPGRSKAEGRSGQGSEGEGAVG